MLEDLAGVVVDAKSLCIGLEASEAGRALMPLGFEAVYEGGTTAFQRGPVRVVLSSEQDGHAPESLADGVDVYNFAESGEFVRFPALSDYLRTLRTGFTAARIAGLSAQRRHNLQRRMMDRVEDREAQLVWGPPAESERLHRRALAVLGRFILLCEQHPAKN